MSQEYIDITEKTQKSKLELTTFEMLQHQELLAGPRRLHSARQHLEMDKNLMNQEPGHSQENATAG
ncbi:hypothetical protein MXB_4973 [Myxobolus squamalis]|nr:hypothetical protein MXB_4973 [Myxobolus squamalis]